MAVGKSRGVERGEGKGDLIPDPTLLCRMCADACLGPLGRRTRMYAVVSGIPRIDGVCTLTQNILTPTLTQCHPPAPRRQLQSRRILSRSRSVSCRHPPTLRPHSASSPLAVHSRTSDRAPAWLKPSALVCCIVSMAEALFAVDNLYREGTRGCT